MNQKHSRLHKAVLDPPHPDHHIRFATFIHWKLARESIRMRPEEKNKYVPFELLSEDQLLRLPQLFMTKLRGQTAALSPSPA